MDNTAHTTASYALIALAASCWGLISLATRSLSALGMTQPLIIFIRVLVSVVALGALLLVKDRSAFRIRLKDLWCFLGTGIASLVFFNYCYFSAISRMSVSTAVVLLYTAPVFVTIFSAVLFKESITAPKVAAMAFVLIGAACATGLIGSNSDFDAAGVALGLGAGLGYALYSIFSRCAFNRGYSSYTVTFHTFLWATIGTLPLIDYADLGSAIICPATIAWSLFLGLICCLLPYLMYTEGLKKVENGRASIVASLEVVVATLAGVFFWKEPLSALGVAGIALIICGVAVMNVKIPSRVRK